MNDIKGAPTSPSQLGEVAIVQALAATSDIGWSPVDDTVAVSIDEIVSSDSESWSEDDNVDEDDASVEEKEEKHDDKRDYEKDERRDRVAPLPFKKLCHIRNESPGEGSMDDDADDDNNDDDSTSSPRSFTARIQQLFKFMIHFRRHSNNQSGWSEERENRKNRGNSGSLAQQPKIHPMRKTQRKTNTNTTQSLSLSLPPGLGLLRAHGYQSHRHLTLKVETLEAASIAKIYTLVYTSILLGSGSTIALVLHLRNMEKINGDHSIQARRRVQFVDLLLSWGIRCLIIAMALIFVRRMYFVRRLEAIQRIVAVISVLLAGAFLFQNIFDVVFTDRLTSSTFVYYCAKPNALSWASVSNAMFCALGFLVLICVTRCYRVTKIGRPIFSQNQMILITSLLTLYVVLRVVASWHAEIVMDFIPLVNVATGIRVYYQDVVHATRILFATALVTIGDFVLATWAWYEVYRTKLCFKTCFVKDIRRLHLGFKFFMFQNAHLVCSLTSCGQIMAWLLPLSYVYHPDSFEGKSRVYCTGTITGSAGYRFSIAVWLFTTLYGCLPAGSKGWKGWFHTSIDIVHPSSNSIKYFINESEVFMKHRFTDISKIGKVDPRHFVLETQIEHFNFSYLAYVCGSKFYGQDFHSFQSLIGDSEYQLVTHIFDVGTDTHCLIAQSSSKIMITFKGTTSLQNAKTDMKTSHIVHPVAREYTIPRTKSALPFVPHNISRPNVCKSNDPWVHAGFFAAYSAVAEEVLGVIRDLLQEKERSIGVTGHSLGGALATLCSFDIVAQLGFQEVLCTTFGCPRVGGNAFKKCYNHAVPATFRFVNASDVVTDTPMRSLFDSFTEVGTTVLLDKTGNLIVDPNILEYDLMHSGISTEAHKLTTYQFSLLMWCLKAHKDTYAPKFWSVSLQQLRSKYGHIGEVVRFCRKIALTTPSAYRFGLKMTRDDGGTTTSSCFTTDEDDDPSAYKARLDTIAVELKQWLPKRTYRKRLFSVGECYSAADAIKYLLDEKHVLNMAAAIEMGRVLLTKGHIALVGASHTFDSKSYFVFDKKRNMKFLLDPKH